MNEFYCLSELLAPLYKGGPNQKNTLNLQNTKLHKVKQSKSKKTNFNHDRSRSSQTQKDEKQLFRQKDRSKFKKRT